MDVKYILRYSDIDFNNGEILLYLIQKLFVKSISMPEEYVTLCTLRGTRDYYTT